MIVGDIETDGLDPSVIHCAVFYDIDKKKLHLFTPENMNELLPFLQQVDSLCMHNGIGFDLKVFKKLLGFEYEGFYRDTLLMARILWPDIEQAKYPDTDGKIVTIKGKHGLAAWGVRLGVAKPVHEDWSRYTPEMLHRCKGDVKITAKLYLKIMEECGDMEKVFNMEHKVWHIVEQQADNGWDFNLKEAYDLVDTFTNKIEDIEQQLHKYLPIKVFMPYKEGVCKAFKADGELTVNAARWVGDSFDEVVGDFCRVKFEKISVNSATQLKEYLLNRGWKPTEWNFKRDKHGKPLRCKFNRVVKTSPKLPATPEEWSVVANDLGTPAIAYIAEYNKAQHRRSQVQGFISNIRDDGRIEAQANTCMTNTTRMTHRIVVNVPKADKKVYYGKELRSLFKAPKGKILIGVDASALEARCEAHYVAKYDLDSAKELIDGDIHQRNADVFNVDRNTAKTAKYAITYGCAAGKFANTLGKATAQAKQVYEEYWDANPGLKALKKSLEDEFDDSGHITAIDGRSLTVRYKHALINTLFQSCGSIVMKLSLCVLDKWLKDAKLYYKFVGNFHDEFQIECNPEDADKIGELAVASMMKAGKLLKLNVPITGEFAKGSNWAETH